eukprot:TRINITY_DN24278_c0_g1_i3.p1 TRINITY_DN24278_c0_g1~~TRINITY_DN24278_c0_g1_i3.p1  ORF type:complete len:953 (+),score=129.01 TRINITY_DN24278_c0_g1_i3:86-2944(+)
MAKTPSWLFIILFIVSAIAQGEEKVERSFVLDWESGFPDGTPHLSPRGIEPSFSFNQKSDVGRCSGSDARRGCKCGEDGFYTEYSPYHCEVNFGNCDIHYQEMMTVDWARQGEGVLKFYADGTALGTGKSVPSGLDASNRCELGAVQSEYQFVVGGEVYYTASFWLPSKYWDQVSLYSIIITQFKMGSDPHGALRISNMGDYKIYMAGGGNLWDNRYTSNEGVEIGIAKKDAWNDLKIYYKKSTGSDGRLRVYLNTKKVFEHAGRTLTSTKDGGYIKFGMYTEIRDQRVIYFDAVRYYTYLPIQFSSEAEWVAEHAHLPTVELTSPSDGVQIAAGAAITLTASANDPAGAKLGTVGKIAKVEFLVEGECVIAEATEEPFQAVYTPREAGTYTFTARATDEDGNVATSAKVITHSGNRPPTVTITSPVTTANLDLGSSTTIQAMASDPDGSVAKVEFFAVKAGEAMHVSLGSVDSASDGVYQVPWTPEDKDGFSLYAVATDDGGVKGTSAYVGVICGGTRSSMTLTPSDDASLKAKTADRDQVNNWGNIEIYARPPADDGPQGIYGIFKVDASSLTSSAEIVDAKLRVYANSVSKPGDFSVWSSVGAEDWKEDTVTWNNGPRKDERISMTRVDKSNKYWDFDITQWLDAKLKTGDALGPLTLWVQGDVEDYEAFNCESSRESNSNKPRIEVTYSDIATPAIPTPEDPLSCKSLIDHGTTTPGLREENHGKGQDSTTQNPNTDNNKDTPSSYVFTPEHDASLRQSDPDSPGNWGQVEAYAKQPDAAIVGLFKFDISSLAGKPVRDAQLKLYIVHLSPETGARFSLWSTIGSSGWNEASVTWNTGPKKDRQVSTLFIDTKDQYLAFDLTDYLRELVLKSADLSNMTLYVQGDEGANEVFECESIRAGNAHPPQLVVLANDDKNSRLDDSSGAKHRRRRLNVLVLAASACLLETFF